jgi:hypothetical protein
MVVDMCRQSLAAEVIVISNLLGDGGCILLPPHAVSKIWLLFIFFCLSAEQKNGSKG